MAAKIGITEITAATGAFTGIAALALGIVNYLRDSPKIKVFLKWDMPVTNNPRYDRNKLWGIVTVSSVGRRPTYIRVVNLKLPKGFRHSYLVLNEGIAGQRLAEGDAPALFITKQGGMHEYTKDWRKVRASVFDTAGREYLSPESRPLAKLQIRLPKPS